MADFYSLLSRAVQGLDQSTGDSRRLLYERVRAVMMEQLRKQKPTLGDLVQQQIAFEEAIKKIEAEEDHKERSLVPGRPPLIVVKGQSKEEDRAEQVRQEPELAARALGSEAERYEKAPNANQLPTDANTLFLPCESIRQEVGGRLTLIGAATNGDIIVPTGTQIVNLTSLAFLFVFRDGEGTFPASFSLIAPSGQTIVDRFKLPDSVNRPGASFNLIIHIAPFQTKEFGRFRVVARLADQDYVRTFVLAAEP